MMPHQSASQVRVVNDETRSRSLVSLIKGGIDEFKLGIAEWRVWHLMGSSEIRRRYSRSRLGQLWIMLSTAVTFSAMAIMWGFLWNIPLAEMMPYVATSYVLWVFFSSLINESTAALFENKAYFANQYLPISVVIFSIAYKNLIILGFNCVLPIAINLALGPPPGLRAFLFLPGFVLLAATGLLGGFLISILCTRFRDFVQITSSVMQVGFFLSPILWKPEQMPEHVKPFLILNPFNVLLSVVRDPLLGRPVPISYWLVAIVIVVALGFACLILVGAYRRRVVFWL